MHLRAAEWQAPRRRSERARPSWAYRLLSLVCFLGGFQACSVHHAQPEMSDVAVATRSPGNAPVRARLTAQLGHTWSIESAVELDGNRILTASMDGTLRIWDGETGRVLQIMEGHTSMILGATILGDGRILSWSADNTLRTWDGVTGRALRVFVGHEGWVWSAREVGKDLLVSQGSRTIRMWRASTGQAVFTFGTVHRPVSHGTPLTDGRILVGYSNGKLEIRDVETGKEEHRLEGHNAKIDGALELSDGRLLTWDSDVQLWIWDGGFGRILNAGTDVKETISGALELADRHILTWANDNSTPLIWDVDTGEVVEVDDPHPRAFLRPTLTDDGRVLTSTYGNDFWLWDVQAGRRTLEISGHGSSVRGALVLDAERVLSWAWDNTLRVWDSNDGTELAVLRGHTDHVTGASLLSDDRVLSWSTDGTLRTWDASTGRALVAFEGHTAPLCGSIELGAGRMISWFEDGTLRAWDGDTGRTLDVLSGHQPGRLTVEALSDGRILSWSGDGSIRLWDGASGSELAVMRGHTSWVEGARILENGHVLSWSGDGTLRTWDPSSGQLLRTMAGHTRAVVGAMPLGDGRFLSWSDDGTLRIWPELDGEPSVVLEGHTVRLAGASVLTDGRILSRSHDGTLRLWDPASGAELAVLSGHDRLVIGGSQLPDGRLLSWSLDHTVRLWDGTTGRSMGILYDHATNCWGATVLEDGRILAWFMDGAIRVLDAEGGGPPIGLDGHTGPIEGVTVREDGRILSRSDDGTIRLWDADTGECLLHLDAHLVGDSGIIDDNGVLISWSADGTHRYWRLETGDLLATAMTSVDGGWAVVSPDGRFDASAGFQGLHFVVRHDEVLALDQLRERFFEPDLLAKLLGKSDEPLRDIENLDEVELWPDVDVSVPRSDATEVRIDLTDRGGGIGEVRVRLNGTEVVADARSTRGNRVPAGATNATLTIDLAGHPKLRPGEENKVEVIAFDGNGTIASRGAVCPLDAPGRTSTARPSLSAIVAGVSDYSQENLDLAYAAKDAADFANALEIAARSGGTFEDVTVRLLSTEAGETPPTRKNLEKAFAALREAGQDDVVVVFLAGHGVQNPKVEDSYMFLTQDAASASGLEDIALQAKWAVSSQELHEWLTQVPAGKQVLILDTCAAGAASDSLRQRRKVSGSQIRAIDRLNRATGMHVLMGSAADAASYEASRYGQGLLTYALLEGMRGPGLDEGGYVDVRTLFGHAQERVGDLARSIGGVQEPEILAPKGVSFALGQLGEEERRQIPLQQARPMISRPSFQNREEAEDDLDLTDLVAAALAERMYAGPRGTEPLVFVDARDVAGGCRPTGNYAVDSGRVDLRLKLKRDGVTVLDTELDSTDTDLDHLVTRIVDSVVSACPVD